MRSAVCAAIIAAVMQLAALAQENPKVRDAFEKFDTALGNEAKRLQRANKPADAEMVLEIQKQVNALKPLIKPGECEKLRQELFIRSLVGTWSRPHFANQYVIAIQPQNVIAIKEISATNGGVVNEATITANAPNRASCKWRSGHVWTIYASDKDILAISENLGDEPFNDGIICHRKR